MIQNWKPWQFAGVKTTEGKDISKMNAYKHGGRSADVRKLSRQLTQCKRALTQIINHF